MFANLSVEASLKTFKNILHQLEASYVPIKKGNCTTGKPIWLSYKAVKAVKRRQRIF